MGFAYGMPWYFYPFQLMPFIGIVFTVLLIWKQVLSFKVVSKVKFGFTIAAIVLISSLLIIWFVELLAASWLEVLIYLKLVNKRLS